MTDEMKLITALCEALGFEVKRETSIRRVITKDYNSYMDEVRRRDAYKEDRGEWDFIGGGQYREIVRTSSYTLTKKKPEIGKWVQY